MGGAPSLPLPTISSIRSSDHLSMIRSLVGENGAPGREIPVEVELTTFTSKSL